MDIKRDIYSLASKICVDVEHQCHNCVETITTSKYNKWNHLLEPIYWDESKWKEISSILHKTFQETGISAIDNLVIDIIDFYVNGHSFIKFGNTYIDPTLKSVGVSDADISKFDRYLYEIYQKI